MTCIETFESSCQRKLPEEGNTLSPWVQITLDKPKEDGVGGSITVGNKSFPSNDNTAVIKSFELGKSDGIQCRVVIQDEQGGSFVKFAEALLKDYKCAKSPFYMKVEFGWISSNCDVPSSINQSDPYYLKLGMMETNFENGKFQYEATGIDVFSVGQEGGSERCIGGEGDQGVHLRDAIEQFLTEDPPPTIESIKFCKVLQGNCIPVAFEDGEKSDENGRSASWKGPKSKWLCQGQDKLRVVMRWLEGYRSENNKSFVPFYDASKPGGEIIFWEDPKPQCGETLNDNCVGMYIVNGGKDSSVVAFNPSFKWDFSMLSSVGGNLSTQTIDPTNNNAKTKGRDDCPTLSRSNNPGAGHGSSTPDSSNHNELFGEEGTEKMRKANDAMFKAMRPADMITADLIIVGDPKITPLKNLNKFVSIAFINPFHLLGSLSIFNLGGPLSTAFDAVGCGEWVALPTCNEVLSNDKWIVRSITHKIDLGKYNTILSVFLAAPGVDLSNGENLGGSVNGWKPPAGCPESA